MKIKRKIKSKSMAISAFFQIFTAFYATDAPPPHPHHLPTNPTASDTATASPRHEERLCFKVFPHVGNSLSITPFDCSTQKVRVPKESGQRVLAPNHRLARRLFSWGFRHTLPLHICTNRGEACVSALAVYVWRRLWLFGRVGLQWGR